jgi:N-acetylglutamate synthase
MQDRLPAAAPAQLVNQGRPDQLAVQRLERAASWSWPPAKIEACHGWLLRCSTDPSRRTNSCATPGFDAGADLEGAIRAVEGLYRARGRSPSFQLTQFAEPASLDEDLARRGYRIAGRTRVLGRAIAEATPLLPAPAIVDLELRPTALVMNALCDPAWGAPERLARAALFGRIRRPCAFAVASLGGHPAAGGLAVIVEGQAGVFAMRTQFAFRRRGLGRAILGRLLDWARNMGAKTAYLQVEESNLAAGELYATAGFEPLYGYHYRVSRE